MVGSTIDVGAGVEEEGYGGGRAAEDSTLEGGGAVRNVMALRLIDGDAVVDEDCYDHWGAVLGCVVEWPGGEIAVWDADGIIRVDGGGAEYRADAGGTVKDDGAEEVVVGGVT